MKDQNDINSLKDVQTLVDEFYTKVRNDELLAPIFNNIIGDDWPKHLEKMYRFWQTILLGEHTYFGSPFSPHATMPIAKEHFERWKKLFFITVDEHFNGESANEAKFRAEKMAEMFLYKIDYYKKNNAKPIL